MNKSIISTKNLIKYYGKTKILNEINFDIHEGDFIAIMGPSGSGKSTLLYSISGMHDFDSGSVKFLNYELFRLKEKKRMKHRLEDMGFVFQQMHMLKNLCIIDNVILPALILRKEKKEFILNRAKSMMEKLSIIDCKDRLVSEVSGGQLQRACICRALINKPKVLFADEPTGSLNSKASNDVMEIFKTINNEGTTVVFVSHDVKIASYASKVIYLLDGNIKGVFEFDQLEKDTSSREKKLKAWLDEKGW